MTVKLEHNPERLKALRDSVAELAKLQSASEQAITEAMREGDLDKARSVLEKASLAVREYEDFRKNFTPKEILLAKYGVEVINDHTVLFVIPKGVSRIEILEEVQGLITRPDGGPFIVPDALAEWKQEDRFFSKQATSKRLCIDGHVPGGDAKTRDEREAFLARQNTSILKRIFDTSILKMIFGNQDSREQFQMANYEDLAVAFCLHWVATGEPLFGWYNRQGSYSYVIRAVGGSLGFFAYGLLAPSIGGVNGYDGFGVSACVSPE